MVLNVEKENLNMLELSVESDLSNKSDDNDDDAESVTESDADDCDDEELEKIFPTTYRLSTEKALTLENDYILHITCSKETVPKICVGLSNNQCEVYTFNSNQLTKLTSLDAHLSNIINVKFSSDPNLLYTGSSDCKIKLWDLRTPKTNVLEFIDSSTNDTQLKSLSSFDVSQNDRLVCGGTELFENDAFLLFWDVRNTNLLGGYWESHTDDITKVLFHPTNKDKLASGSTDGLINIYDLREASEDEALLNSLNTDSSVEQFIWYGVDLKNICCVTHTAEIQLWDSEEATSFVTFSRDDLTKSIKRKSAEHCYVANAHLKKSNELFLLTGSNWHKGECVRAVNVKDNKSLVPCFKLEDNKQRIRASWFNEDTEMFITGGEQCILSVWQEASKITNKIINNPLKSKSKINKRKSIL